MQLEVIIHWNIWGKHLKVKITHFLKGRKRDALDCAAYSKKTYLCVACATSKNIPQSYMCVEVGVCLCVSGKHFFNQIQFKFRSNIRIYMVVVCWTAGLQGKSSKQFQHYIRAQFFNHSGITLSITKKQKIRNSVCVGL